MIECESCGALWEDTQIPNLVARALFPGFGGGGGWVKSLFVTDWRLRRQNLPRTRTIEPARRLTASRSPYLSLSPLCLKIFTEDS